MRVKNDNCWQRQLHFPAILKHQTITPERTYKMMNQDYGKRTCMMKMRKQHDAIAALVAFGLALTTSASEAPKEDMNMKSENRTWTLATKDTEMTLTMASNTLSLARLLNPAQNWNWTPAPAPVPLPSVQGKKVNWKFCEAAEEKTNGYQLTLHFICDDPALEMKSIWRALPGTGPVENEVSIENKSGGDVTFGPDIVAARIDLVADAAVTLHRAEKTAMGTGKVLQDVIGPNAKFSTRTGTIPLIILGVGFTHGAYFGFEWELGGFNVVSQTDPLRMAVSAHPITENVTRGKGEVFVIPSVYYGVYQGDIDDGANRFKRWFWNHKITRSLHDNENEPWVEVCMQDFHHSSMSYGFSRQSTYDRLAADGAECVKLDFWDGTTKGWYTKQDWTFRPEAWPNGFDFAAKAHKAGLKASLYMGGTYLDCDLTTLAGRDAELEAVQSRYDQGWFDMWRTDKYTAPREPIPQSYQGVANFLFIQDRLIKDRPGYRYENCCNGGKYKGFAICRRMTFCTMNDFALDPVAIRTTYFSNTYAINPVQLKSDLAPAQTAYQLRTDMLGAILTGDRSGYGNHVFRQHIALYKVRQRPILRGANVYHILPMPDGKNWDGLQFHNPDLDRGSVFLFKPTSQAPASQVVRLRGLIRDKTYDVLFQDTVERSCSMTGAKLMDEGMTVTLTGDNVSEIIWINCPELSVDPAEVVFTVADQGVKAAPQQISIAYRRSPDMGKAFTVTAADPWLRVAPVSGAGNGQIIAVSVDPCDMPSDIYRSKVIVSHPDLPDKIEVSVRMQIGLPVPKVVTITPAIGGCVVNGNRRFSSVVEDQFGEPFAAQMQWMASGGGKVDDQGMFQSDGTAGVFVVTGTVAGYLLATATARMHVASTPQFARWKLDEKDGAIATDTWGEIHGTLVGDPTWVPGRLGGALFFNGKDQYVDTKSSLEKLQLPCTFAFWVKPGNTQITYADIFGNHENSTLGVVMQQNGNEFNKYSFGYGSTPPPGGGAGPVQLVADEWQHVAVVCDGKEVIIYLNGAVAARGTGVKPLTPNPNLGFRLGSGHACGRFFNGALDDFRIYASALSGAEVAALAKGLDEAEETTRGK